MRLFAGRGNPEEDVIDAYLSRLEARGATATTVRNWRYKLRPLAAWLAPTPITAAKRKHIEGYLLYMRERMKPTSVFSNFGAIKAFYSDLARVGTIKANPAAGLVVKKPYPENMPTPPLLEVRTRFLAVCGDQRERLIIMALSHLGLRVNELAVARFQDIDERPGFIRIHGKGAKDRFLPLSDGLKVALEVARRDNPDNPYVVGWKGKPTPLSTNEIRRIITWLARFAKMPYVRPHTFRRSFATWLIEQTGDFELVRQWLGHSDVGTTARYVSNAPERLVKVTDLLDSGPTPETPPGEPIPILRLV